jgi:hypothetical protein
MTATQLRADANAAEDAHALFDLAMQAADEIDRLTPRWREGEPPDAAFVWREACPYPVEVRHSVDGVFWFDSGHPGASTIGAWVRWTSDVYTRWAPIARLP